MDQVVGSSLVLVVESKNTVVDDATGEKGANFTDALDAELLKSLKHWELLIPKGGGFSELIEIEIVCSIVSAHVNELCISLGSSFLEFFGIVRKHLKHNVEPVFVLVVSTCVDSRPKKAGIRHVE